MKQAEGFRIEREPASAGLTLDRPPLNVLDGSTILRLRQALDDLALDTGIHALVVSGAGKGFSAGVDVADHLPDRLAPTLAAFHGVCQALCRFPVPTVAVVHGMALGGGLELACACDIVLVAEDARLAQPEIRLAALPSFACAAYPIWVGRHRAADWILTGREIPPPEAERAGLITRTLPARDLRAAKEEILRTLTSTSRTALAACKKALQAGGASNLEERVAIVESLYVQEHGATPDATEGLRAFLEKRKPVWE